MCGIVAVIPSIPSKPALQGSDVVATFDWALERLSSLASDRASLTRSALQQGEHAVTARLEALNSSLQGPMGVSCLLGGLNEHLASQTQADHANYKQDLDLVQHVRSSCDKLSALVDKLEAPEGSVETDMIAFEPDGATRLRDLLWAIGHDRVGCALGVASLSARNNTPSDLHAVVSYWAIQVALSALERLEVRGRDSAGLEVLVSGHDLDLDSPDLVEMTKARVQDPLYRSGAMRRCNGSLSFVYKTAREVGSLGDNVRALSEAISSDRLLKLALSAPSSKVTVLSHTRWASVGRVSEANAHPLDSTELTSNSSALVIAAVNGDVDNHLELAQKHHLSWSSGITTDSKVVPVLVSEELHDGSTLASALGKVASALSGSMATAVVSAHEPDKMALAVRGTGQSLVVGIAEGAYVIASEVYGVVEETSRYLRVESAAGEPRVLEISREGVGSVAGLTWHEVATRTGAASGASFEADSSAQVTEEELSSATVTTRDIDRRHYPHYLLKEISEAPVSLGKTLRGRVVVSDDGTLAVHLGPASLPTDLVTALSEGSIRRVLAIGQGTAAVACRSVAASVAKFVPSVSSQALAATELSGFNLVEDMSDTLIIAVSQSGTTTDTNRAVTLAAARGAWVIAVVNRRDSDLAKRSHGVVYTSDGRDVEMSVASTKAFYNQVAAGLLLALALARATGEHDRRDEARVLQALIRLPSLMNEVLSKRPEIEAAARQLAPSRRSWAVVGSGPETVAAAEVRIKLSELCYKSVACDTVEDKKHIDLSSEPLVVVLAAGLRGALADDLIKEVAIFAAQGASPVVVVADGYQDHLSEGIAVVTIPDCEPEIVCILSAMAGHLFAYEAAVAIDSLADPLRRARHLLEEERAAVSIGSPVGRRREPEQIRVALGEILTLLGSGAYDGNLDASTALNVMQLSMWAIGRLSIDDFEASRGRIGTPEAIRDELLAALDLAVDAMGRPIDAVKHQAKTVTVGTSRTEIDLSTVALVAAAAKAAGDIANLGYRALTSLAALDCAVVAVEGHTRYEVTPGPKGLLDATVRVVEKAGIAEHLASRTEHDPRLRGTKHRAAQEREVTVFTGSLDGRSGIVVPEIKGGQVRAITLLHTRFVERLSPAEAKEMLSGYRGRYAAIADAVTERQPDMSDEVLGAIDVKELLTQPVALLATRWQT